MARGVIRDTNYSLLNTLIELGYLETSRTKPLQMRFRIRSGPDATNRNPVDQEIVPSSQTEFKIVNIINLRGKGTAPDSGYIEFIGIDPPSWRLNAGDGSGKVYVGNVGDVIEKVIKDYAPEMELDIGKTIDSRNNKWAMMRQDPKTFISSLMDWSSSVTPQRSQWLINMDGGSEFGANGKIIIKEMAEIQSRRRAYYKYRQSEGHDTIKSWELLSNNALSIMDTRIITQGLSAISGQYLDRVTDQFSNKVFARDATTSSKTIARTDSKKSTTKPNDPNLKSIEVDRGIVGWTSVNAIPEHSAGDLGIKYDRYIDGRARGMYLNLVNALMRLKLTVLGHGEWSSLDGLGIDTVFLNWFGHSRDGGGKVFFLAGNWLIYGFHHRMTRREWLTDLYLARFDHNAEARAVPLEQ